jgi:uncharacterized protein YraI
LCQRGLERTVSPLVLRGERSRRYVGVTVLEQAGAAFVVFEDGGRKEIGMNRLLLSLWLAGAAVYAADTLAIVGWPHGHKQITDRVENEGPASAANAQSQNADTPSGAKAQTAENADPHPAPSPDSSPQLAASPQGSGAQSAGAERSGANAPIPPTAPPTGGQSEQDQVSSTTPETPQTQAQAQPQGAQTLPPPQPQQQTSDEWVKIASSGANVRAGPSPSAAQLGTVPPGAALRVVSRQAGWVEVANSDGSQTGWIYESLLEPGEAPGVQAPAPQNSTTTPAAEQQSQGELVKVSTSTGTMRSGPSEDAPVLFSFPNGRVFRLVSRKPGWVEVMDMSSKQTGWIAESSIEPVSSSAGQQAAGTLPPQQPQGAPRHEGAESEAAAPEGVWRSQDEYVGPPPGMIEGDQPPSHWGAHRRHGRLAAILRRALGGL